MVKPETNERALAEQLTILERELDEPRKSDIQEFYVQLQIRGALRALRRLIYKKEERFAHFDD